LEFDTANDDNSRRRYGLKLVASLAFNVPELASKAAYPTAFNYKAALRPLHYSRIRFELLAAGFKLVYGSCVIEQHT
jgi:hypothetical protein